MTGRVIHTGQAIVDLVMEISALPEPGGDVFARSSEFTAGGGFNVMAAAARDGASVAYVGGHGTGPFGDTVRAALHAEGIEIVADPIAELDTGFSIALVEDSAERTFVSKLGAEGAVGSENYDAAQVAADDVVYVSGYSLLHEANRSALLEWLPRIDRKATVVFDPSPLIDEIDIDAIRAVADRVNVWSTNQREAELLELRLGIATDRHGPSQGTLRKLAGSLADSLSCDVVLRVGAQGCIIAISESGEVLDIAGHAVEAVDTNGAGDAHCGVLCTGLAAKLPLAVVARRANIAAAIAVTRRGPATGPLKAEIDDALI